MELSLGVPEHAILREDKASNTFEVGECSEFQSANTNKPTTGCDRSLRVVVHEGHARLTAYFLNEKHVPEQLEVIIGFSEKIDQWDLY